MGILLGISPEISPGFLNKKFELEIPREILREIPGEILREIPGEIRREIPGEILREIPGEIVREIPGKIPREIPREISKYRSPITGIKLKYRRLLGTSSVPYVRAPVASA